MAESTLQERLVYKRMTQSSNEHKSQYHENDYASNKFPSCSNDYKKPEENESYQKLCKFCKQKEYHETKFRSKKQTNFRDFREGQYSPRPLIRDLEVGETTDPADIETEEVSDPYEPEDASSQNSSCTSD